ncbi:LapA family protein [Rubrivirga sp. S365]|uniref:LapA family protein n=1 Tax=Rubrivirga sp. S365 TaxID=3076080 RepID=UPI0028C53D6B|nr:LapA family protein [Rubrivirga sp. S365]MDT7857619.1 LapA family protein [Rubrivirga sp. S365]
MRFALALLLVFAVLGILLATRPENLQNDVALALPFTSITWVGPVLWMLAGWFGAGILVGYLIALPGRIGASRRARRVEKELGQTQVVKEKAVGHLNTPEPAPRPGAPTEADEMQRLADEVARRTETVKRDPPRA